MFEKQGMVQDGWIDCKFVILLYSKWRRLGLSIAWGTRQGFGGAAPYELETKCCSHRRATRGRDKGTGRKLVNMKRNKRSIAVIVWYHQGNHTSLSLLSNEKLYSRSQPHNVVPSNSCRPSSKSLIMSSDLQWLLIRVGWIDITCFSTRWTNFYLYYTEKQLTHGETSPRGTRLL
jgi:hypothetical protein